jgi:hypothetical protein
MTKADQAIETAAEKLDAFVRDARRQGGVKAKVGNALAEDPEFLRKLKPSLVRARAKGGVAGRAGPRAVCAGAEAREAEAARRRAESLGDRRGRARGRLRAREVRRLEGSCPPPYLRPHATSPTTRRRS